MYIIQCTLYMQYYNLKFISYILLSIFYTIPYKKIYFLVKFNAALSCNKIQKVKNTREFLCTVKTDQNATKLIFDTKYLSSISNGCVLINYIKRCLKLKFWNLKN